MLAMRPAVACDGVPDLLTRLGFPPTKLKEFQPRPMRSCEMSAMMHNVTPTEPSPSSGRNQALEAFAREYGGAQERSRVTILVTPGESDKTFPVAVYGLVPSSRFMILGAPATADGSLIAVMKGQTLSCRWVNASSAFLFDALITKILFDPVPLLFTRLDDRVRRRSVRNLPRALANMPAAIRLPGVATALVVDLSVGGARIAVLQEVKLEVGQELELSLKPKVLERDHLLKLRCQVMGGREKGPAAHPGVVFYGLKFVDVPEHDLLIIHSYVQASLVDETDQLANMLFNSPQLTGMTD